MSDNELTKAEKLLLYGLKQFNVEFEDAMCIATYLKEDEKWILINYMQTRPNATAQDIINQSGKLCEQSKKTSGLNRVDKALIYNLSLFPISEKEQETIFTLLKEEDDKLLMIAFLLDFQDATAQEIFNECERLIEQRKNIFGKND